jgi:peptidoglycan/xylan/chitin deacetylase (PgdA/CDA1 family)
MLSEQLRKLPSEMVEIGSHTMTHRVLPKLDRDVIRKEAEVSRSKLEEMLGQSVSLLSFPYGAFDERVLGVCREVGYKRVFSALPLFAFSKPGEFLTGRTGVYVSDWPIEFRLKLRGAYRWLPLMFRLKRRLMSLLPNRLDK